MKNLLTFEQFINESHLNEKVLNSKQLIKEKGVFDAQSYIDEKTEDGDVEIANETKQACDILGELPTNVFGMSQYTEDTNNGVDTYDMISQKFRGKTIPSKGGKDSIISYDAKMGVVQIASTLDDFEIYWFTAKSKF